MSDTRTPRLLLRPMAVDDAEELFAFFHDPVMWWYDPAGRHPELSHTRAYAERAAARWESDGLSYWTVRLAATGAVIGSGGAQLHSSGEWNLNYRIAPGHQGHGYAGELLAQARAFAAAADAGRPCIAWIDAHNEPSVRVAERARLLSRGVRGATFDGRPRLAYADRPLDDAVFPPQ